ncbi:phosphoribosylanthranilate isomerase [Fructilactobacillus vespulae]|uniref:phosphoribosylanthranilate isomerase n=1 Tax=Fructilactobacillus vespulae TaxID=1249630 RepID=UPI0039B41C7F
MVKIKICGIQTVDDVQKINIEKPDLVGFVFAASKRQISLSQAKVLKSNLLPDIETVGVFANPEFTDVQSALKQKIIKTVQYYGDLTPEIVDKIHSLNGKVIQVVKAENEIISQSDLVMIDGSKGRGLAPKTFKKLGTKKPQVLSGGIKLENVEAALAIVRPAIVDISSGVETNGIKDQAKIAKVIAKIKNFEEN